MTQAPVLEPVDDPFWEVVVVFDPDEPWRDFGYTVGLAERGLPELHAYAYAYPSLGEDAAPDWRFSSRDLCVVLNRVAGRLASGSVGVGSQWVHDYDHGLTQVTFRIDPPGDRDRLEAWMTDPDGEVLPVRWSVSRAPRGPRGRLHPEEHTALKQRYRDLLDEIDPMLDLPDPWRLPGRASYLPGQRYGPRTPLVRARAAWICSLEPDRLATVLARCAAVDQAGSITWSTATGAALARPLGLDDALRQLQDDVDDLLVLFDEAGPLHSRWEEAISRCEGPDPGGGEELARGYRRAMRHLLHDAVVAAVTAEALGRDATDPVWLPALGPMVRLDLTDGAPPGPQWQAAPEVIEAVHGVLAELTRVELRRLIALHLAARDDDEAYEMLLWRLEGYALSSPCCMPAAVTCHRELQVWLTAVAAAVVHRAELRAVDVERLCAPVWEVVPGLQRLLNEPL